MHLNILNGLKWHKVTSFGINKFYMDGHAWMYNLESVEVGLLVSQLVFQSLKGIRSKEHHSSIYLDPQLNFLSSSLPQGLTGC